MRRRTIPPMRRSTKVGGFIVGIGTGVAAVLWMLRDRLLKPETTPVGVEDAPAFRVAPAPAPARADADDLTEIKGIGPVYKARLAAGGFSRFDELAKASPGQIAEVADVTEARAAEWVEQAAKLA
jgi:predicted flap endonuclease-1-like 5' DNA nuclease